jgi:DNA polymerase III subunit chi
MTQIDFYHYTSDRFLYACNLASKVYGMGRKVCVNLDTEADAERFDHLLWTYQQLKFIPHVRMKTAKPEVVSATPILLLTEGDEPPHHDVLINLSSQWPKPFASFERLLEIVEHDETQKQSARERYKFYKSRGFEIQVRQIDA